MSTQAPLDASAEKRRLLAEILRKRAGESRVFPLSFAQQRLWFLDRMEPGSSAYNVARAVRMVGELNVEALRAALGEIVRRHGSLRTAFTTAAGDPAQVVSPPSADFPLPVTPAAGATPDEREAAALGMAAEEAGRPFDLEAGPLFRAKLLRIDERDHLLVLVLHHVVTDGWSMGVFFRELAALYPAFAAGQPSPLPEPGLQYTDFAAWQRKHLAGEVLERQLGYWRGRLAGAPPLLELPTDRPRPAVQSRNGATHRTTLPGPVVDGLRGLARSEGATPFMALLAALQLLLGRYSGQDDVVVGTPVAGRTRAELEGLIGFFVNSLAIRTDLGGDPSFRALLGAVKDAVLEAQAHQDLPFERLVEGLRIERGLAYSPVFQVMFALHAAASTDLALPGLELRPVRLPGTAAKFDLSVEAYDAGDRIHLDLEYDTDLFDGATVERLGEHLRVLLESAVGAPDAPVAELAILDDEERRRVVREWNDTDRPYPSALVHELFAAQAARTPDAPAVLTDDGPVTYAELHRRSDRIARALRARGAGPETRVGLCLERGPEMPAAVLGVLKAGAAYVPLDPAYPAERLRYVLADAGVPLVVATPESAASLPDIGGVVVDPASPEPLYPASEPGADAVLPTLAGEGGVGSAGLSPDSLAYVIYTSGSTGAPKGVEVTHRGLANLLRGVRDGFGYGPGDMVPVLASYAFDIWGFEALAPLLAGGAVRVVPKDGVVDVPRLVETVRSSTAVHAVPALMRQVAAAVAASPEGPVAGVRRVFVGGDAVPPDLLPEIRAAFPEAEVRVLYGPTEATVLAAAHLVGPGERAEGHVLGRPLPNARTYVLDPAGRPSAVRVPGELYLGGPGVARGYLGRPDLTAERFVPDPFSGAAGERLYRTGDRARWRADGVLEFLGRTDAQVKVRGFRIEPGEVEAALSAAPGVREAAVAVREDAPGERRLVGYVVGDAASDAVREWVRARLPEHMVPSAVVVLDAFPLTPTGKVDRRALPAPGAGAAAEHVPPRTPVEAALAGIWAEVLRVERVGAHDDFFALGGHSLLATRVQARVRAALDVEIPLRAVFEAPTVALLAGRVEASLREAAGSELPPLVPAARDGALPLSFAQERLWVLDRLDPGSGAYAMPFAFRLTGALDVDALGRALDAVVERHESLRTVFTDAEGRPAQRVLPAAPVPLPQADLSGLPEAERTARARERAAEEARRGFDLEAGSLFRAGLLRLAADEHVLLLSLHHAVGDGWSMGVLFHDLSALYAAFSRGEPSSLAAPALQYADFAVWQRGWLAGEVLDRQLAFWRGRLAGAPPALELPTDRPRPAAWDPDGAMHPFAISAEVRRALEGLARKEGATPFMVLLAAWQLLLAKYAGEDDVVVGTPIAGRTHRATEEMVGLFVNSLALRTDLGGDPTFRELLKRVRRETLDAYAHQDLPFEKLVEELAPERSLDRNPVFQVFFALQNAPAAELELPGVGAEVLPTGAFAAKFDLSLGMYEQGEGFAAGLGYATALFDAATAARMAEHFGALLERIAADPDARLSGVSLLGAEEREAVLGGWNATDAPRPAGLRAHDLFAEAAARHPDAPAVLSGGGATTYAELEAYSNRIARRLLALGVGPEVPVGICMDASPDAVAAALGVMKAGGCYVPLDPSYPPERLRLVLDDAAVPVLLTRSAAMGSLPEHAARTLVVDDPSSGVGKEADSPPDGGALPENAAYVIYTSGSTGRPKGVRVEHRNLVDFQLGVREVFGMGPGDVVPSLSSFAFDIWAFEALLPLVSGGATRLVPRERVADAERVLAEVADATALHAVPALMRRIAAAAKAAGPGALPRLRSAFVGGDAVSSDLLEEMGEAFAGVRVRVLYGPTEGTVLCAVYEVSEGVRAGRQMIGRPLPNARLYVLDRAGEPVPAGVAGELCLGGVGVARGYAGRPDLTAEKWIPDAFGGGAGTRLYRTGDRARRLPDGTLEFLGRVDAQVKVRGFRIEPGEVEAALLAHPRVRDAVVVAREDAPGERRLVGYVVREGDSPDAAELRAFLRERLPEPMVPSALVALDAFPLTPTGKVDRRALPAPEAPGEDAAGAPPRTPAEEVLAGIWAELLRLEHVGRDGDFFELGGHSLLATQLASRVRRVFGVEIPVRAVFEAPTPAALAERLDALLRSGEEGIALPPLERVVRDGEDVAPSFAQERLWVLQQMDPESAAYNMPFFLRVRGTLDVQALREALDALAARHPSLRTVFPEAGGVPVQRVLPPSPVPFAVEDLSGSGEEAPEERARTWAGEEARRPFDLASGPLFRAALARLGDDDHLLTLSLHHAVCDGWSAGVLFRDLDALYDARVRGGTAALPVPSVGYSDFSVWQRKWLAGEVLARQAWFWRGRLAGAPPVLELPLDRPRAATQATRGAEHAFSLPPELRRAVEALSRREAATPFMTLLAAWQLLLAKYAGEEDVVVGTPVAGRTHEALEDVVGMFVNTLALRTDLSGDPPFRELLERVRHATLDAYAHQDLPFEKVVEEVAEGRRLSHHPVFQVFFSLQNAPSAPPRLAGLAVSPLNVGSGATKFDLSLSMVESRDGLGGVLGYAAELFDAATVERIAGHFRVLLERIVADPGARLSTLSPLDADERERVLAAGNASDRALPATLVHERFAEQARATPDAVALACGAERVTYAELDARAEGIAARLRETGVAPEARVGICLDRGADTVAAVLGVMKSGGAYVPLDPSYPAERLRFVAADAGLSVLLTRGPLAGTVPCPGVEVVRVEDVPRADAAAPTEVSPGNAAYLIYTSGTTGRPKGVVVEHGGLANTLLGSLDGFGLGGCHVGAGLASYAFDIWGFEVLTPLLAGGMVRLVPREDVVDTQRLVAELEEVSALHAVPALMRQVAAEVRASGRGTLPRMRLAFVGGDAVSPDLLDEMREVFPNARIRVLYGPTEATVLATGHPVEEGERVARKLLGAPLANVRAYVLDAFGEPVPAGVPGELYLGGRGVARGYHGRPELTAERFVPDPFGGGDGARLYRTGDRARRLPDGTLEFLGRVDAQVKVRGFRIEPGEVEAALAAHPAVRLAAVVAREDAAGEKRLVGYATLDPDAAPVAAGELRSFLRERLPDHMVPAELLVLEALPLTATGKVDRKALPAPERPLGEVEEELGLRRTPTEEVVAAAWAEVLRLPRVGSREDFFELGGHSLLATQVISRLRAAFRVELPVRALFEAPTVAGLAERVDAAMRAGQGGSAPPLARADRSAPLPLSFAQERLWVIDRMDPGSAAYNMPFSLRLRGALDVGALRAALDALVERHESLRTTFPAPDGRPVQVVGPAAGAPFRMETLDGVPDEEREVRARAEADAEAWRPFDLAEGPLFRAVLYRISESDHLLVLAQHHAVTDGWSMGVVFRELSALYGSFVKGEPSPLAPLPVQYGDYAAWQRAWLAGDALDRQVEYWRLHLAGAPPLIELPTDRPRRGVQSTDGASHHFRVPAETLDALRTLSHAEGATLFMTVLAAFQLLLSRYARQDDVVVGTPIAGRTQEALEGLVGMFVNTLALRTRLDGDPSFRGLLGRVREGTLGAYAHQDLPFEKLVDELQPQRDVTHAPVFQVMFSLQNLPSAALRLPGLTLEPVEAESRTTKFDLALALADTGDGLVGALEFATELFDAPTAERMAGHFATLLARVAEAPGARISTLSPMSEAERRLLAGWSGAPGEAATWLVHERIAEHARADAGAPAVFFGDEVVTRGELDARVERLAGRLRRLGVGPEVRVGIAADRGPDLIVSALAVLRAGGTYLPLDPSYPADRLDFMVEDAAVRVVVAERRHADRLGGFGGVRVAPDGTVLAGDASTVPPAAGTAVSSGNAAYVIYTSGSTGRPKGVAVTHGSLASFLSVLADSLGMDSSDTVSSQGSFSFDVWVLEVLLPLATGGSVRPIARDRVLDADALLDELERVTTSFMVPALMRAVGARLRAAERTLPAMRRAFCGGDVVPPDLLREMRAVFPSAGVGVLYGPTEVTVAATGFVAGDPVPERNRIGKPLPGVAAHVCDPAGEPVPIGVPGELWLGGEQVARGYPGRPELAAERFVPDPFSGAPGARMYRTGDLVRWLPDGDLEFLGRVDHQVKVRGFRIELGEIESALSRREGVRGVVALVREDRPGDRRIVAYLEADPGLSGEDVLDAARGVLPEYMVPSAVVVMETFPLTPSGKVDRRALPAPEADADERHAAPRTELERVIAAAWEEVLGVSGIGVHRTFFDLGGNSLLVVQAVGRLEAALGRKVPVLDLFQHSTVAALARHLSGGEEPDAAPSGEAAEERSGKLSAGKGRLGLLRKRTRNTER